MKKDALHAAKEEESTAGLVDSPYASPQPLDEREFRADLPVPVLQRGILTVLESAALFSTVGMLLGLAIGTFFPAYYHSVFSRAAQNASFDPVQVGIGLGLTQGFAGGAVIGLIVVVLTAWSHRKRVAA